MKLDPVLSYVFPAKIRLIRWIKKKDIVVLLDPNKRKYYRLNRVGSYIWEISDGSQNIQEIINTVLKEFLVAVKTAQKDTIDFLNLAYKNGLMQFYGSNVKVKK